MKAILCSWIGKVSIVKMTVVLKVIYWYNAIPINILTAVFQKYKCTSSSIYGIVRDSNWENNIKIDKIGRVILSILVLLQGYGIAQKGVLNK